MVGALAGSLLVHPAGLGAQDASALRIEQEDKLLVPLDRAEEVWEFLHAWLVEDAEALRTLDPALHATVSEELFSDIYFDSPDLALLEDGHGVRFRQRFNLTDPSDPKHGRALVQMKLSGISADGLERGEYKFDVAGSIEPPQALLGLVARSQRDALRRRLAERRVDVDRMERILTIEQRRRRIYLTRGSTPFMSVSHDHVTARKLWARAEFVEIEPELNEVTYTRADSVGRAYMAGIGRRISEAVLESFPRVERDLTPKYEKAFRRVSRRVPGLRTLVRLRLHDSDRVAAMGVIALGLFAAVGTAAARGVQSLSEDREA